MDKSKVFFTNLHTTPSSNLLDKMERLIKRAGIEIWGVIRSGFLRVGGNEAKSVYL